jgi:hypothetical protein
MIEVVELCASTVGYGDDSAGSGGETIRAGFYE